MSNNLFIQILIITILLVSAIGISITYLIYKNNSRKLQSEIKKQKILPESRHDVNIRDLESTKSGRKLLDIYKAPFKYLKDFSEPELIDSKKEQVVVWGSVGSGKSWLLAALSASFYKYNSSDMLYSIQSGEREDHIDPFTTPYSPPPTSHPILEHYQFARRFRNTGITHKISSQKHRIMVWDTQGGAADSYDYSESQNEILQSADYLIFTLDHTLITYLNKDEGKEKQLSVLKRVFDTWKTSKPQNRPRIAICLTKIDLLPLDIIDLEPLEILHTVFGNEIYNLIINNPNTKVFATSAMGFITDKDGVKANYNQGELLNLDKWEPFGVEYPFFWLFEIRTMDSLGNNLPKKLLYKMFYIQYPKPSLKLMPTNYLNIKD
jgi:GTPase SAR1 family protein